MKIYAASKAKHGPWWAALRAAGLDISSTWPEWRFNYNGEQPTAEEWGSHWRTCIEQSANCDLLLLLCLDGEIQKGALIELGAALANNGKVIIVSPYPWSWKHCPNVICSERLSDAIELIRKLEEQT